MKLIEIKPLLEFIQTSNIIDFYIVSAMPITKETQPTIDEVIDRVKKNIENELWIIILTEMSSGTKETEELQHLDNIYYTTSKESLKKDKTTVKIINKLSKLLLQTPSNDLYENYKNIMDIRAEMIFIKSNIQDYGDTSNIRSIIENLKHKNMKLNENSVVNFFNSLTWNPGFGGEAWANIAKLGFDTINENNTKIFISKLDRFADTAHNNGSILTKMKYYDKLMSLLDYKQESKNIRELIPFASHKIQKLLRSDDWRLRMMQMPGMGAGESIEGLVTTISKYMDNPSHLKQIIQSLMKNFPKNKVMQAYQEAQKNKLKRKSKLSLKK